MFQSSIKLIFIHSFKVVLQIFSLIAFKYPYHANVPLGRLTQAATHLHLRDQFDFLLLTRKTFFKLFSPISKRPKNYLMNLNVTLKQQELLPTSSLSWTFPPQGPRCFRPTSLPISSQHLQYKPKCMKNTTSRKFLKIILRWLFPCVLE